MAGNWSSNLTPDMVMQTRRKLEGVAGTRPAFAAIAVSESVALAEIERDEADTDRAGISSGPGSEVWTGGNKAGRIKAALHDLGLVHFIRKDNG